jgi:hypothetical protein
MERILHSRTTTSSQMTPLEYILTEILDASSSHLPYCSFFDKCGVTQAYEIISLSENDFETTTFFTSPEPVTDETVPVATTLNKVQRNKLSKIISWFNHQGDDVSDETWYALTANTLRYWKPAVSKAPTIPDTVSRTTESPSSKFRKGIKNHPVTYAKFHEDRFWTNWDTNIRIMLRVQGAPNVLNSKDVPITEAEIEVFTDQQTYVFGIFNETVLTTQGRDIIKRHSDALDAQAVYCDLVAVYSHGINAKLSASNLSAKLTNYHHDTVKSKTCVSFLTNWRSLVYNLDRIKPDSLSESQKCPGSKTL